MAQGPFPQTASHVIVIYQYHHKILKDTILSENPLPPRISHLWFQWIWSYK